MRSTIRLFPLSSNYRAHTLLFVPLRRTTNDSRCSRLCCFFTNLHLYFFLQIAYDFCLFLSNNMASESSESRQNTKSGALHGISLGFFNAWNKTESCSLCLFLSLKEISYNRFTFYYTMPSRQNVARTGVAQVIAFVHWDRQICPRWFTTLCTRRDKGVHNGSRQIHFSTTLTPYT